MLKKSASGVLGSSKSSTYPRGYASGFDSPAALLDGHFEHPEVIPVSTPHGRFLRDNGVLNEFFNRLASVSLP